MKKIEVNHENLLKFIIGLREYRSLINEVSEMNPVFKKISADVLFLEARILLLNKLIHRQYDNMEIGEYTDAIDEKIKSGKLKSDNGR